MSVNTWGTLAKNSADPEKIEEAIARLIKAHNEEPEAHLCDGCALSQHKLEEVIDHLAESIVSDKISEGAIGGRALSYSEGVIKPDVGIEASWGTFYHSNGYGEFELGFLHLATGDTDGNVAAAYTGLGWFNRINWEKNWLWQITAAIGDDQDNDITFGFCASNISAGNFDGAFFRYVNGNMWVGVSDNDGDEVLASIDPVSTGVNDHHTYRIRYDAQNDKLLFYIDGDLVHTFDPPTRKGNTTGLGTFEIKTTKNSRKHFFVVDMLIEVCYL